MTELSLRVFSEELALQSKRPIKGTSVERAYEQMQARIELLDPDRPARDVLRQILGESRRSFLARSLGSGPPRIYAGSPL